MSEFQQFIKDMCEENSQSMDVVFCIKELYNLYSAFVPLEKIIIIPNKFEPWSNGNDDIRLL